MYNLLEQAGIDNLDTLKDYGVSDVVIAILRFKNGVLVSIDESDNTTEFTIYYDNDYKEVFSLGNDGKFKLVV